MLLIAISGTANAAELVSADAAMTQYREMTGTGPAHSPSCPKSGNPDEIVVCARPRASPYRLPLPDERHAHTVRGELARADSVNDDDGGPHRAAPGINLLGLGSWLYGLAKDATASDE